MTHGHAHEEAEHASHHSADPFDRRVAMTMVVIAAVLAAVKVMGHRAHNDTLTYQIQANVAHTQASNLFSFFQAKRQRMELTALQATQLELIVPLTTAGEKPPSPAPNEALPDRAKRLESLVKDLKQDEVEDAIAQAEKIISGGEQRYRQLRQKGFSSERASQLVGLEMNGKRYRLEADAINKRAAAEREMAEQFQKKSTHSHHQANFFDAGELFVELGLVVCSVAILSKRPPFWYGGMALGLVGVIVFALGFFVH